MIIMVSAFVPEVNKRTCFGAFILYTIRGCDRYHNVSILAKKNRFMYHEIKYQKLTIRDLDSILSGGCRVISKRMHFCCGIFMWRQSVTGIRYIDLLKATADMNITMKHSLLITQLLITNLTPLPNKVWNVFKRLNFSLFYALRKKSGFESGFRGKIGIRIGIQ